MTPSSSTTPSTTLRGSDAGGSMLAGATGGLVVSIVLQPLETLKTRSQLHTHGL